MGERGSGAAFGAPSRVFLAAVVLACIGPALHARAEGPQAEVVASTTPSAVEPAAAPSDTGKEGQAPAAPAAGEENSIRPPAENTEGNSPAGEAVAPAGEDVPDPAGDSETATPAPKPEEAKPAETAAPAAPESEPKPPESATAPAAPSGTPATVQAQPSSPDPLMAAIASKLKDPALRKGAAADDLAALEAFYNERSGAPLWVTPMGFTARAQALIAEIQNAGNWGLPAGSLRPAVRVGSAGIHRGASRRRGQARARGLEICPLCPGRTPLARKDQRAVRPEARIGQPEDRVDRDRGRAVARRLSHLATAEAGPVRGPAQADDQVCGQRQGARTQADGRSIHPAADRQHGAVALDARRSRQLLRLEQRALFRHAGDEGRQVHLCREGHRRAAEIRHPAVLGEHALH